MGEENKAKVDVPACTPPSFTFCTGESGCVCVIPMPPPPRACEVRIVYPEGAPAQAQVLSVPDYCDAAGLELALAVALARLLGAP